MASVNIKRSEYSAELKNEFLTETGNQKKYTLAFTDGTVLTGSNITSDGIAIKESICSGDNIDFATVEKASLEMTLINLDQSIADLNGKTFSATIAVNGETMDYGTWTITECTREDDDLYTIKAYDQMIKFDADASAWWNTLKTPITLKNALISLCDYVGIDYCLPDEYTNSEVVIEELGVEVQNTIGAEFLGYFQELAGLFFRMPRSYGNGTVLVPLSITKSDVKTLYPSLSLYPSNNLYPGYSMASNDGKAGIISCSYNGTLFTGDVSISDYETAPIDKVQIKGSDNDIGAIAGSGENAYIIANNVLTYGFDAAKLEEIAQAIILTVESIVYTPFEGELKGLPYVEPGDTIRITTPAGKQIMTFLLNRDLSGTQDLNDSMTAKGSRNRKQVTQVNRTIKVLNQKMLEVIQTVEENTTKMTDIQKNLQTQITQNAESINIQAMSTKAPNMISNSQFDDLNAVTQNDRIRTVNGTQYILYDTEIEQNADGRQLVLTFHPSVVHEYAKASGWYDKVTSYPTYFSLLWGMFSTSNPDVTTGDYFQYHVKHYFRNLPSVDVQVYVGLWIRYTANDGSSKNTWPFSTRYIAQNNNGAKTVRTRMQGTLTADDLKTATLMNVQDGIDLIIENSSQLAEMEDFQVVVKEPYLIKNIKYSETQPFFPWGSYNNVSSANVISQINVAPDGIKIAGSKVDIYGLTTFHGTGDSDSYTKINGPEITAGTITGTTITGATINGSSFNALSGTSVLASFHQTNTGFEIAGSGSFQIACKDLFLSPQNHLWVLKPGTTTATAGFDGDITFKNWDASLKRLRFTQGIAWYYENAEWSSGGGFTGTVNGMYYRNGIAMNYNGGEGTH